MPVPDNDLVLSTESLPTATVIHVAGDLDLSTVDSLDHELDRVGGAGTLVLDLSECTFLDSSALRSIVLAHRKAEAAGGSLAIVATTPATLRVFEVASLDEILAIYATVSDATGG